MRLTLAHNQSRWFFHHLLALAIVALPFLRPLRLVRLLVLFVVLQKAFRSNVAQRMDALHAEIRRLTTGDRT